MELKPGYKQTEVGVIPEDWDCVHIGVVAETSSGATPSRAKQQEYFDGGTIPWVKTLDLNNSSILETDECITLSALQQTSLRLYPRGSVLVAMYGGFNQIGRTGMLTEKATINQALTAIRPDPSRLSSKFLLNYLNFRVEYWKSVASSSRKDPNITGRDVREFPIALPPLREQEAAGEALQDIEDHIFMLGELIAKKTEIKQAAMQELLTGKRRLPGFEGEWEEKKLGDEIRDLEAGVSVRSTTDKDQPSTGRYILKTSAVSQGQFLPTETKEIISCDIGRAKTPIKAGDLIISRMNTPALVGECGYSRSDHPNLFLPDRLWRAAYRDPHAVSSRWLSYTLSTQQNRARIKELATGTSGSMKNISKRALLDLEIKWPSLAEQNAIAEVLSEMDDDIDAINAQLEKAQGVKQGMMQQLLTGKIRLQ